MKYKEPKFWVVYSEIDWDTGKFATLLDAEAHAEMILEANPHDTVYILVPIEKVTAEEETIINTTWEDL